MKRQISEARVWQRTRLGEQKVKSLRVVSEGMGGGGNEERQGSGMLGGDDGGKIREES